MKYIRKTRVEWTVETYMGLWYSVHTATSRRDAKDALRDYRANQPGLRHRIVKRRVQIASTPAAV